MGLIAIRLTLIKCDGSLWVSDSDPKFICSTEASGVPSRAFRAGASLPTS